eukprot:scaffold139984_cov32-Tisochrysis_lutea.AAC.2
MATRSGGCLHTEGNEYGSCVSTPVPLVPHISQSPSLLAEPKPNLNSNPHSKSESRSVKGVEMSWRKSGGDARAHWRVAIRAVSPTSQSNISGAEKSGMVTEAERPCAATGRSGRTGRQPRPVWQGPRRRGGEYVDDGDGALPRIRRRAGRRDPALEMGFSVVLSEGPAGLKCARTTRKRRGVEQPAAR